ncbi:uncharacterized protein LOC121592218 [Anopheles merus]|uniref:uncharacterized protein LOC121592218 n=1 Tax=Anopheles merus TaxID=30066 RepID=UPI001BE3D1DC|nr:uncharacterized protein LOC121592218 [Anopheles merus]
MSAAEMLKGSIWSCGPEWLALSPSKWPMSNPSLTAETDMEIRQTRTLQSSQVTSAALPITPEAIEAAKIVLCKLAQEHEFSSEIQLLKKGEMVRKQSPLRRLNPFLDNDGILRVGGRLKLAQLPYQFKHPILLPKNHQLAHLIAVHIHEKLMHGGEDYYFPGYDLPLVRWYAANTIAGPGKPRSQQQKQQRQPQRQGFAGSQQQQQQQRQPQRQVVGGSQQQQHHSVDSSSSHNNRRAVYYAATSPAGASAAAAAAAKGLAKPDKIEVIQSAGHTWYTLYQNVSG